MRLYQEPQRRKKELSYRCLTSGVVSVTFQYYYSLVPHLSSTSIVSSTVIWKLTIAWIEKTDFIYGRICPLQNCASCMSLAVKSIFHSSSKEFHSPVPLGTWIPHDGSQGEAPTKDRMEGRG